MLHDEDLLLSRLEKLAALFARAGTPGERSAAGAAIERLTDRLGKGEATTELQFSLDDAWGVKLFLAICRKHGIQPYRYPRQRRTTLVVNAPRRVIEEVIVPEYRALREELIGYFNDTLDQLISGSMESDGDDSGLETRRILA